MKTLLFLIAFLPLACSPEDPVEDPSLKNTVAIGSHCQGLDIDVYTVSNSTMSNIKTHDICDEVSFTDLKGEDITGILVGFGTSRY